MKKAIIIVVIIIAFANLSCRDAFEPSTRGNPGSGNRILVGGSSNEFLDSVVETIIAKLEDIAYIEVVSPGKLRRADYSEYDAVIVTGEVQAWMFFNRTVRKAAKRIDDPGKLIVILTAGDPDYEWEPGSGITAITSATPENPDPKVVIEEVSSRLEKLLN